MFPKAERREGKEEREKEEGKEERKKEEWKKGKERGEREKRKEKINTFILLSSGIYEPRINHNKELQRYKDA